MLHVLDAFGFKDDSDNLIFMRKYKGQEADWSLGAVLYELQYMPLVVSFDNGNVATPTATLVTTPTVSDPFFEVLLVSGTAIITALITALTMHSWYSKTYVALLS